MISPYGHAPDHEPERAIRVLTVSSRSGPHDTISIDSNEPMQDIRISLSQQQ